MTYHGSGLRLSDDVSWFWTEVKMTYHGSGLRLSDDVPWFWKVKMTVWLCWIFFTKSEISFTLIVSSSI